MPYSAIIGLGKYWQKVYLEGMVGKYLANLNLNKIICIYIINIDLKVPKNFVREAIGSKRCSTKLYTCVIECVIEFMFEFTVNKATTSSY